MLAKRVLACEKKSVGRSVHLQLFDQAAVGVLQSVSFVNDDESPANFLEMGAIVHGNLVGSDEDVLGLPLDALDLVNLVQLLPSQIGSLSLRAVVQDDRQQRRKPLELVHPVGNGGERSNDEVGSRHAHLNQVAKESNCLDGLAQAHLVPQDAIDALKSDLIGKVFENFR
jgi:hypothetical protein